MPILVVTTGPDKGNRYALEKEVVTLGRKHSNDVVIPDLMVSRTHARIRRQGDDFLIEDMGGTNPVKLNDRVVKEEFLREGDKILLGNTTLEYHMREVPVSGTRVEIVPGEGDIRNETIRVSLHTSDSDLHRSSFGGAAPLGLQRDHRRLADLFRLSHVVITLQDSVDLFNTVIRAVFDNVSPRRAFVGLWDSDLETLRECVAEDREEGEGGTIEISSTLLKKAMRDREAILTEDAASDQKFDGAESIAALRIRSTMLAPLVFNDEVLGIIYVDDRKRSNRFSEDDLKFLTSLGNLTAMAIANLRLRQQLVEENRHLRSVLGDDDIVGESREIKKILSQIGKVAGHTTTVLITGESGTGKEMVAKAIHKASERADKPFVAVNCAAIPEGLIEAELFGFAQDSGIANASTKGKPGKFELAHTGTLFLDEVGDMPLATQVKILRALQERKIERLGGTTSTPVNIRIVTATNKSLEQSVRDGSFREDLFFRLRVFAIEVPPLRQRGDDIVLLAEQYLKRKTGGRATLADRTKEILSQYSWPGNVRELFNCLERAAILGDGKTIRPTDLPREVRGPGAAVGTQVLSLSQMEKRHITDVLEKTGGNKSQAAKILDISRDTLYQKIKQFGLE